MPDRDPADGIKSVLSAANLTGSVSRETVEKFRIYADELVRWQARINLVADGSLKTMWNRHFLDSAQLRAHAPDARTWLDLGSGAGFPGLVLAILGAEDVENRVTLVEVDAKKCAFLRHVARLTDAPVKIISRRVEKVRQDQTGPIDIVTARGFAPAGTLFDYAAPWLTDGAKGLFLKGAGLDAELEIAGKRWDYSAIRRQSLSSPTGTVLEISALRRKSA